MMFIGMTQGYVIQGIDLEVEYWAGFGPNECVVAVDWNNTNGPYHSAFHIFGFRWDQTQVSVKDALIAIDQTGDLDIEYGFGGGYISHMFYDQSLVDGDNHTTVGYKGWWWAGQTEDGGLTWQSNSGGVDAEYVWDGGIEVFNINGTNWGSDSMTIPEPTTFGLLAAGFLMRVRHKRISNL